MWRQQGNLSPTFLDAYISPKAHRNKSKKQKVEILRNPYTPHPHWSFRHASPLLAETAVPRLLLAGEGWQSRRPPFYVSVEKGKSWKEGVRFSDSLWREARCEGKTTYKDWVIWRDRTRVVVLKSFVWFELFNFIVVESVELYGAMEGCLWMIWRMVQRESWRRRYVFRLLLLTLQDQQQINKILKMKIYSSKICKSRMTLKIVVYFSLKVNVQFISNCRICKYNYTNKDI